MDAVFRLFLPIPGRYFCAEEFCKYLFDIYPLHIPCILRLSDVKLGWSFILQNYWKQYLFKSTYKRIVFKIFFIHGCFQTSPKSKWRFPALRLTAFFGAKKFYFKKIRVKIPTELYLKSYGFHIYNRYAFMSIGEYIPMTI